MLSDLIVRDEDSRSHPFSAHGPADGETQEVKDVIEVGDFGLIQG
jgi:hypothetical protein